MDRARHRVVRWHWLAAGLAGLLLLAWSGWRPAATLPLGVGPVERTRWSLSSPDLRGPVQSPPFATRAVTLPASADARWSALLATSAGDDDDAVAACRLAVLIDDCQLVRDVDAMIDTELSMAAREGRAADSVADEILRLDASAAPARESCGDAPPELLAHGWSFLLRAALAGHEPSMFRFVIDLPRDPSRPAEDAAALAAWHRHAPALLDRLVQRRSLQALPIAYRAAQGFPIAGDEVLQPRDPFVVMRLGSALALVLGDDSTLDVDLALLEHELPAAQRRAARAQGERLADAFLQAGQAPLAPAFDEECAAGWPGMPAAWLAYGTQPGD